MLIARYYCPKSRVTISLLPDFLSSHLPGTLDEIEAAVAAYESTGSVSEAADAVRPPDDHEGRKDPFSLEATTRWMKRRITMVSACLLAIVGIFPELFKGCEATVTAFRARLGTSSVLVDLRGIAMSELSVLPPPLGFGPWPRPRRYCKNRKTQKTCRRKPP